MKILVIEDNLGDVGLLRESLKSSAIACSLEHVSTLADAIVRVGSGSYDVILLDLGLPDSQGVDTIRKISRCASRIPIIVMTGIDDEAVGIEALHSGAQDYLVKGQADGKLLARAIRYATERKAIELELRKVQDELEARVRQRTADLEEAITALGEEASERNRLDESRRGFEGLLQRMAEFVPSVLWIVDVETYTVMYVNSAYRRIFGLDPDDLYKDVKAWRKVLHPDDRQRVENAIADWRDKGGWRRNANLPLSLRIIRSDGQIRNIKGQAFAITCERNRLKFLCGVFDDVTETAFPDATKIAVANTL